MRKPGVDSLAADEDGGREVFDSPLLRKPFPENASSSLRKIYPSASDAAYNSDGKSANPPPHGSPADPRLSRKPIIFQVVIAVVACVCLVWTLWLILLNIAPNETINRVMNTETFDYGSFWLMVDPTKAMMGLV
ncbi:hypothetical protein PF003_g6408 [Phytophthora fragariae]|nr:hypothetical protein PF003_g6408 [Phytophthora fragariae]